MVAICTSPFAAAHWHSLGADVSSPAAAGGVGAVRAAHMSGQPDQRARAALPARESPEAQGRDGADPRSGAASWAPLLAQALDEIDYGLLLLGGDRSHVVHANHAARACLDSADHPLRLSGGALLTRWAEDASALQQALEAARRGLRRLLALGRADHRAGIAVVPLGGAGDAAATPRGDGATLVVLGRREVCGDLAVQGYARAHHLSPGESQVLQALCAGCSPLEIAARHAVKLSTVRTQIANVRAKTGAESIRDLVQQVALLPPMVGVLRKAHAGDLCAQAA